MVTQGTDHEQAWLVGGWKVVERPVLVSRLGKGCAFLYHPHLEHRGCPRAYTNSSGDLDPIPSFL